MRLTVGHKLFFSVLCVSLFTLALVVGLTTWNLRQGFSTYLAQSELNRQDALVKRLEDVYAARGNWSLFKDQPATWLRFVTPERVSTSNQGLDVLSSVVFADESAVNWPLSERGFERSLLVRVQRVPGDASSPASGSDPARRAPPSALEDCRGKQSGDEVWHRTPEGVVRSTCIQSPEGLVARPNPPGRQGPVQSSQTPAPGVPLQTAPERRPESARVPVPQRDSEVEPETAEAVAARRFVLMDREGRYLAGMRAHASDAVVSRALKHEGRTVGQLGLVVTAASSAMDQSFIDHSVQMVMIVAGGALVLSALAALLLSRNFTSILRQVTLGTRRLASGEYAVRLAVDRRDEFGDLVQDFNRLAHALEQHESNRRLWVAQTSHELRTPISILRAHIEALIDEVRAPSRQEFEVLHKETMRLTKLVSDLNDLARADSGALAFKKDTVALFDLLDSSLEAFAQQFSARDLRIEYKRAADVLIFGDAGRLRQLFANIFENVLRYTDAGGRLRISAQVLEHSVELCLEDSAPGVETAALGSLFDPFYRTSGSRQRETSGSGLGLAICKSIVMAHEGSIEAFSSDLGGLKLRVTFPLLERHT